MRPEGEKFRLVVVGPKEVEQVVIDQILATPDVNVSEIGESDVENFLRNKQQKAWDDEKRNLLELSSNVNLRIDKREESTMLALERYFTSHIQVCGERMKRGNILVPDFDEFVDSVRSVIQSSTDFYNSFESQAYELRGRTRLYYESERFDYILNPRKLRASLYANGIGVNSRTITEISAEEEVGKYTVSSVTDSLFWGAVKYNDAVKSAQGPQQDNASFDYIT